MENLFLPRILLGIALAQWIATIAAFPATVEALTKDLSCVEKNWRYRPDGWTIKQVVHHCADSHMNSLIRFKLSLTEEEPTIRPYLEDRWALLVDSQDDDLTASQALLMGLHYKWVQVLRALSEQELERGFIHPEQGKRITLTEAIAMYAWHCRHHLAHIEQALATKGRYNS